MYICIQLIGRCFGKDFHLRNANSSDESLFFMVHGGFFPWLVWVLGLFCIYLLLQCPHLIYPSISNHLFFPSNAFVFFFLLKLFLPLTSLMVILFCSFYNHVISVYSSTINISEYIIFLQFLFSHSSLSERLS